MTEIASTIIEKQINLVELMKKRERSKKELEKGVRTEIRLETKANISGRGIKSESLDQLTKSI